MKKMIKRTLNQYGFSLVEIMVAVAIVGILTVIAIPQYQKYQRRALQGEAKMLLSNLYTIERAFSLNWGYGATNLPQMGFKATGSVSYNVGWNSKKNAPTGCNTNRKQAAIQGDSKCAGYQGPGIHASSPCGNVPKLVNTHFLCPSPPKTGCNCTHFETTPVTDAIPQDDGAGTDIQVENNTYRGVKFMIGASRQFSNKKQDVWTINHNRRLKNVKSGI